MPCCSDSKHILDLPHFISRQLLEISLLPNEKLLSYNSICHFLILVHGTLVNNSSSSSMKQSFYSLKAIIIACWVSCLQPAHPCCFGHSSQDMVSRPLKSLGQIPSDPTLYLVCLNLSLLKYLFFLFQP